MPEWNHILVNWFQPQVWPPWFGEKENQRKNTKNLSEPTAWSQDISISVWGPSDNVLQYLQHPEAYIYIFRPRFWDMYIMYLHTYARTYVRTYVCICTHIKLEIRKLRGRKATKTNLDTKRTIETKIIDFMHTGILCFEKMQKCIGLYIHNTF